MPRLCRKVSIVESNVFCSVWLLVCCSGEEEEMLGGDLRDLSHSHSSLCVCVCVGMGGGGREGLSTEDFRV